MIAMTRLGKEEVTLTIDEDLHFQGQSSMPDQFILELKKGGG